MLCLLLPWGAIASLAEIEPTRELSLFQLIARAELVVHVRVREGALKYATVDVQEVIKGVPPATSLRIDFRDVNWQRPRGEDPMVFPDGQEEVLFLARNPRRKAKEKNRDILDLFEGRHGRITLPAEGEGVLLEALRDLAELTRIEPITQANRLLALMRSHNPYLLQASLDEIIRLGVAEPADYVDIVALFTDLSPGIRGRALRIVRQIFASGIIDDSAGEVGPDQARATLDAVMERARNDPDPEVRVLAVTTISAWPVRVDIESALSAIANQDRSQMVRYEAERALFRMRYSR